MSDCLPDDQLRQLIIAEPGQHKPGHERHVAGCPVCMDRMKHLLSDSPLSRDTVADAATGPFDHATAPADPTFPVIPGYTIKRILGQGGMGVVYEAEEHDLHPQVALKVIHTGGPTAAPLNTLSSAKEIDRLLNEAKLLAKLNHPAVAHIYQAIRGWAVAG